MLDPSPTNNQDACRGPRRTRTVNDVQWADLCNVVVNHLAASAPGLSEQGVSSCDRNELVINLLGSEPALADTSVHLFGRRVADLLCLSVTIEMKSPEGHMRPLQFSPTIPPGVRVALPTDFLEKYDVIDPRDVEWAARQLSNGHGEKNFTIERSHVNCVPTSLLETLDRIAEDPAIFKDPEYEIETIVVPKTCNGVELTKVVLPNQRTPLSELEGDARRIQAIINFKERYNANSTDRGGYLEVVFAKKCWSSDHTQIQKDCAEAGLPVVIFVTTDDCTTVAVGETLAENRTGVRSDTGRTSRFFAETIGSVANEDGILEVPWSAIQRSFSIRKRNEFTSDAIISPFEIESYFGLPRFEEQYLAFGSRNSMHEDAVAIVGNTLHVVNVFPSLAIPANTPLDRELMDIGLSIYDLPAQQNLPLWPKRLLSEVELSPNRYVLAMRHSFPLTGDEMILGEPELAVGLTRISEILPPSRAPEELTELARRLEHRRKDLGHVVNKTTDPLQREFQARVAMTSCIFAAKNQIPIVYRDQPYPSRARLAQHIHETVLDKSAAYHLSGEIMSTDTLRDAYALVNNALPRGAEVLHALILDNSRFTTDPTSRHAMFGGESYAFTTGALRRDLARFNLFQLGAHVLGLPLRSKQEAEKAAEMASVAHLSANLIKTISESSQFFGQWVEVHVHPNRPGEPISFNLHTLRGEISLKQSKKLPAGPRKILIKGFNIQKGVLVGALS